MCLDNSVMKLWQNALLHYLIYLWDQNQHHFPPPIGNVVKLFLKFARMLKILKYLNLQKGENEVLLYGPIAEFICMRYPLFT
jgi:hypothetical protein